MIVTKLPNRDTVLQPVVDHVFFFYYLVGNFDFYQFVEMQAGQPMCGSAVRFAVASLKHGISYFQKKNVYVYKTK
jgi:hypothetical protein